MKKQPWVSFTLSNVSLTEFGLKIPSPFVSLTLSNSEITSTTSWTLRCVVGGDDTKKVNVAAFEALLYSAAQAISSYPNASGIPVSFAFGWLDEKGKITDYLSYQGFTLTFKVSTSGLYMQYEITGFASLAMQCSMPVLRIPELTGFVQPSAVFCALVKATKADTFYEIDVDHTDAPTLVSHGAMTTSFNKYVRGSFSAEDNYEEFPGLLKLSKTYSGSRDSAGLNSYKAKKLSQVLNNANYTPVEEFLKSSNTDLTPQCSAYSYWVDEPTSTKLGVIHYKSNANLSMSQISDTLRYGTRDSNVISLQGSYNGVAYNMTNMRFSTVGFSLDESGNTIIQDAEVVNSWSSSLSDVFQTVNIINDVNATASQFSGDFTVTIPGTTKTYQIAQPVSLLVMTGNTLSPISGIYNVMSVSHTIGTTFTTTLKIQRLVMSSANDVASSQGIFISGSGAYPRSSYTTTSNVKSTSYVDFGILYPDFTCMQLS